MTNPDSASLPLNFAELVDEIDEDMVPVVFESFLDDTKYILESLRSSLESGQAELLRKNAHKVKGCCTTLRAHNSAALAKKLEQAADKSDLDTATKLLDEFSVEYARLINFIENYMATTVK